MGGVVALLDKTPFLFGFETGSKCAITNGQVEILKLGKNVVREYLISYLSLGEG